MQELIDIEDRKSNISASGLDFASDRSGEVYQSKSSSVTQSAGMSFSRSTNTMSGDVNPSGIKITRSSEAEQQRKANRHSSSVLSVQSSVGSANRPKWRQSFVGTIEKSDPKTLQKKCNITKKKHELLLAEMKKKQVDYFGRTQHNFMRNTDAQGDQIKQKKNNTSAEVENRPSQIQNKSLMQDAVNEQGFCGCFKPNKAEEINDNDVSLLDASGFGFNASLRRTATNRNTTKKKFSIVPNTNMDQWIKFMMNNLNELQEEYSWDWSESLLKCVDENSDKFNMGKFRGAIFNMNFIAAEKTSITKGNKNKEVKTGGVTNGKIDRTPIANKDPKTMGREFARSKISKNNNQLQFNQNTDEYPQEESVLSLSGRDRLDSVFEVSQRSNSMYKTGMTDVDGNASLHSFERASLLFKDDIFGSNTDQQAPNLLVSIIQENNRKKSPTIENMPKRVRELFFRIKKQLVEDDHPLMFIIRHFQEQFLFDYDAELKKHLHRSQLKMPVFDSDEEEKEEDKFEEPNYLIQHAASVRGDSFKTSGRNDRPSEAFDRKKDSLSSPVVLQKGTTFSQRKRKESLYDKLEVSQDLKDLAVDSFFEVNQFLSILYGTCVRFYNTVVRWQDLDMMKEDLVECLTSRLFCNDEFSHLLLDLSRIATFDDEKLFVKRLREIKHLKPKDVGISPYLTLDKSCKIEQVWNELYPQTNTGEVGGSNAFNKKLDVITEEQSQNNTTNVFESFNNSTKTPENLLIQEESNENPEAFLAELTRHMSQKGDLHGSTQMYIETKESSRSMTSPPTIQLSEVQRRMKCIDVKPYQACIEQLQEINNSCATPFEKLTCFQQISESIKLHIREFWKGVGVKQDKLTLDGDQIIMIYVYIAAKAKVPNLFAQIQLAKAFATPFIRTTRFGYCLTTLEIALKLVNENEFLAPEEETEEVKDSSSNDGIDFDADKQWQNRARSMSMSMRRSVQARSNSVSEQAFSLDIEAEHQDFMRMSYDPGMHSRSNSIVHKSSRNSIDGGRPDFIREDINDNAEMPDRPRSYRF